jgi:hypothetical protein
MDKKEIILPTSKWGTLKSKYKPESNYVSNDEFTVGSYNFLTNVNGAITKRPTDVQYNPVALPLIGKDQFEAIFNSGTHHLLFMDGTKMYYTSGDQLMHIVADGASYPNTFTAAASMEWCMFQNRVYFDNGVDTPGVYDLTSVYGSAAPVTVPALKPMGCQPPPATPKITFADDSAGGAVATGGYYYAATFLYYGFEESNGGATSIIHNVTGPKTVNLIAVPIGGYGVTARNIYRAPNLSGTPGTFLLVGTILDNTTTTFADTVSAGTIPMPTFNNLPPTFSYIVLNLSRLWVAGVAGTPSELYWSTPGEPDVFDPDNSIQCNPGDPIQALAVYQGITIVMNRHSIGQILGTTDDSFYYQGVPGSVGCVDNRSIQIRTLDGVPTLMWLSDRGIYGFNGSSVFYMSDPIEDEVSLNIQQVNFVTGSRALSTLADWEAGFNGLGQSIISFPRGIDLSTNPGEITTINPTKIFQTEADWEDVLGSLDNVSTLDGSNSLKVPVAFAPTLSQGTLGGSAYIDGTNTKLPTFPDWSGDSKSGPYNPATSILNTPTALNGINEIATPIEVPRDGSITGFSFSFYMQAGATHIYPYTVPVSYEIYNDALGTPGSSIFSAAGTVTFPTQSPAILFTMNSGAISFPLSAGVRYWLVFRLNPGVTTGTGVFRIYRAQITSSQYNNAGSLSYGRINLGLWGALSHSETGGNIGLAAGSYTFSQAPVSKNGSWSSGTPAVPSYDSFSTHIGTGMSVVVSGTYPGASSGSILVYGSADNLNFIPTDTLLSPNGTISITGGNYRWWKLVSTITTPDDRVTPIMGTPILKFNTTGTWISPPIETTLDGTSFISLVSDNNVPAGTSATYTVSTSADNITYSPFTDIALATISRYAKIKAVLTATPDDMNTPSVSSLTLDWNLASTFVTNIIDIGQIPSGWGLFQDSSTTNGGTVSFLMRSATTSAALSADPTWSTIVGHPVSNGAFPPDVTPYKYTQIKIILSSLPDQLPTVDSLTVNWLTGGNATPCRVASLFVQKTYFLAAAEINSVDSNNQPLNNIVIVYDQEGLWRLFRGLNINSLSLFFNQPYYLDAVRKYLYQWLTPPTGLSGAIMMDVRTKAFDLGLLDNLKNVRSCRVVGTNTGTTIHTYYSVDRGTTWTEMLNTAGTLGYTTSTDGNKFSEYFVADYSSTNLTSGTTIMFRVTSDDNLPCEIYQIKPCLYVRKGKYIQEAL